MTEEVKKGRVAKVNAVRSERSAFLVEQFGFPYKYDRSLERRAIICQEKIRPEHMEICLAKHLGEDCEYNLEEWIKKADNEDVLAFLEDLMKADKSITWTGFRVTGYLYGGADQAALTFDLFAKHPSSDTEVYTGDDAPNVRHQLMPLKQEGLNFCQEAHNAG